MAEKQIHQLEPVIAATPDDQLVVSGGFDQLTGRTIPGELQVRLDHGNAVGRSIKEKLEERVSVKDFGAVGDGQIDDTLAFQTALTSNAGAIFVPAGRYRLTSELLLAPKTRLYGAASGRTTIVADHNAHVLRATALGELGVQLEDLAFELGGSADGLWLQGDKASLRNIEISGGSPNIWGIDFVDTNNIDVHRAKIGGVGASVFRGNGIRWRNSNPATNPSNYGVGLLQAIDIRLGSENTTGILLQGQSTRLITNAMLAKIHIIAPASGATPFAGTVGIRMESCVRMTLQSVDLEALAIGVQELGISNALGASVGNQYIGVYVINVGVAYEDSNGTISRSVQQRTFLGCDNFPATVGLNDGDAVLPAGLWLQSFVYGDNAVRMRCFSGHELIIDDGAEVGSLALDVGGNSPRVAPKETGSGVRLYIGRGSSISANTMRDVTIEPVLRLGPRSDQNPSPTSGQMAYADGTNWNPGQGEGFYFFERGGWRKVAYQG